VKHNKAIEMMSYPPLRSGYATPHRVRNWLYKMTRKYSPLYLLLLLICAGANAEDEARCIGSDLVEIDGMLPGMNEASLEAQKAFLQKESIGGEDDGGGYTGQHFTFSNYQVITVRGIIDSIHITSPSIIWAHGIHLGTDRDSIDRVLGFAEVFRGDYDSQYLVCSDIGDTYAVLRYEKNELTGIEVVIERP